MQPLTGVNVLEITHYMSGPSTGRDLHEFGANVIKVEPPGGEPTRNAHPFAPDGTSFYFATYNFGKRSICLDLHLEPDKAILVKLIKWADVLVTNYSVGVPERLGFGFADVHEINPRTIMVHITGFGSWSKYRDFPAYDVTIQAMSAVASMVGEPDRPPNIVSIALADQVSGLHATTAALAALQLRERTGVGELVEVSMMRAMTRFIGTPVALASRGDNVTRTGNRANRRFVNMYSTSDGYIVPCPISEVQWKHMCHAIGHPEWASPDVAEGFPPRYLSDNDLRTEIDLAVAEWAKGRTTREAVDVLLSADVPCSPVLSVMELIDVDKELDLRLFENIQLVDGEEMTVSVSTPEWLGLEQSTENRRVHAPGEDSAAILAELNEH